MTEILYGAIGVIAVILLLIAGFVAGWKFHTLYHKKTAQAVKIELTEQERKRAKEEAEAFDQLANYSADIAYGISHYDNGGNA